VNDRPKLPLDSPLAARWSLFAAHALGGLMANSDPDFGSRAGINWAARAAELADDLLREHEARFSAAAPRAVAGPAAPAQRPPAGDPRRR
jgi:hypothetical protein